MKTHNDKHDKKGGGYFLRLFVFLLLAAVVVTSCHSKSSSDANVLATVNGQEITVERFKHELKTAQTAYAQKPPDDPISKLQIKTAFLSQLIERTLVEQETAKAGLKVEDDELKQALTQIRNDYPDQATFENALLEKGTSLKVLADQVKHGIMVDKLVAARILPKIVVPEDEIKRFYESHPERFTMPEGIRVAQIVTRSEELAQRALSDLSSGVSFADAARKYSVAPEASRGGDLGWISRGQLPAALEQAAFALADAGTSGIIRTDFGYHILRLTGRRTVGKTPLEAVRDAILEEIRESKVDEAWNQFINDLRSSAKITIDQATLAAIP